MKKIALFCNAGMSTSMLVKKMRASAQQQGIEVEIEAYPASEMDQRTEGLDAVLLGPQVKFMLSNAKKICEPKGIPVDVINSMDYGMVKGDKVLEAALSMMQTEGGGAQ